MTQSTLLHRLQAWAKERPEAVALADRIRAETWSTQSWGQYWDKVQAFAAGLVALGHRPGEAVAIIGENRSEWVIAQLGIMAAGGLPAPIYTTNTASQVAYIVRHCRAKIAVCDGEAQLAKLAEVAANMPLENVISMDPVATGDDAPWHVRDLPGLLTLAGDDAKAEVGARLEKISPDDVAMLIYTSGTTGEPKGVQLDHGGMCMLADAVLSRFPQIQGEPEAYRTVSYLPLCHIAEQLFTNLFHLSTGGQVYFCRRLDELKDHLVEVRPTCFVGVPRVWEKFQAAMTAQFEKASGLKGALLRWALATELANYQAGDRRSLARLVANRLVQGKIKRKLGLDQVRVAGSGAAPIGLDTLRFFASLGIPIYEAYGMSETTGVATVSAPDATILGKVGRPIPGVEVRIAGDGEIMLKGRNMTRGYLHAPEDTAALFDEDGWMHTGDLGALDGEGFLQVTGRKKDLLITAGGKNVAPSEIESYLLTLREVSQAVVVGDRRPYLTALLVIDPEALLAWASGEGLVADSSEGQTRFFAWLEGRIAREVNSKLAPYQTIKRFALLDHELTIEGGELTPTMKLKRNVIHGKYGHVIEGLYDAVALAS